MRVEVYNNTDPEEALRACYITSLHSVIHSGSCPVSTKIMMIIT